MEKCDKQMNTAHHINVQRLKSDQRQGPKKEKRAKSLSDACSKRDHEIHFLRRMMRRVGRPHYVYCVAPAVYPVEDKIDAEQQENERPPIHLDRKEPIVFPKITVNDINTGSDEDVHSLISKRGPEIRDRLRKRDVFSFVNNA
jgi:hypothetical protein